MARLHGHPEVLLGLAAGERTEGVDLALALLEAYPADAGLELRALDASVEWLQSGPAHVSPLTRQALETTGVDAWRASGRKAGDASALARSAASVAAGRRGADLLAEAVTLSAMTHVDPQSLICCATFCLGLRALLDGADYDDAWRDAEAMVSAADIASLAAGLGAEYAGEVRDALDNARTEVREALRAGVSPHTGVVASLQTAVNGGRSATWEGASALTGAVLAARGLLPSDERVQQLGFASRWSAWPVDATGRGAAERIEQSCRRAAGVIEPETTPEHVPPFVVRRLHPQVLYGRNPVFADEAAALAGAGVTHLIDLREPWEWQGPNRLGRDAVDWLDAHDVARLHLPTADGGAPTRGAIGAAVRHLESAVSSGGVAFVHCRAGQERTGAILLAWMLTRGVDLDGLRALAPGLRPLPNQQAAAYDWLRARA